MFYLAHTATTPEANLALDEVLLNECEEGHLNGAIRIWESDKTFVVLGVGNKVKSEVYLDRATVDGVPVFRRISGGGAVVQGPGCVNFCVVKPLTDLEDPSISGVNSFVMERSRLAVTKALGLTEDELSVNGVSDLTLKGQKFSGNAQRRLKRSFLFHGTFLIDFDTTLFEKYLRTPSRAPEYRDGRGHSDFVTQLKRLSRSRLKDALFEFWGAEEPLKFNFSNQMEELIKERYSQDTWNLKL